MLRFLLTIILIIGLIYGGFYLYESNQNVESKINLMKIDYAISTNSSPQSVIEFSNALSTIKSNDSDRAFIELERNYYRALGLYKEVNEYIKTKEPLFDSRCKEDYKIDQMNAKITESINNLESAKEQFELVKGSFSDQKVQEWTYRITNLDTYSDEAKATLSLICYK